MDRLTIRYPDGAVELKCSVNNAVMRLAAYEDTDLEPKEIAQLITARPGITGILKDLLELSYYRRAEAEGRLIVRPGTVYQTDGVNIYESTVRKVIYDTGHFAFDDDAIGRSVFLTREEAEAALGRYQG